MRNPIILLAALTLGACGAMPKNQASTTIYDFGLPTARLVSDSLWSKLALEVKTPAWFDSLNVDYRLAYDDPLKPREYVEARWAGTPGTLLALRLQQQLGVMSSSGVAAADCVLRIELQEFSQIFDSPQNSRGVLQASVSLLDARRQIVVERQLNVERPAASPDARGGVNALATASAEFGERIGEWLEKLKERGAFKRCERKT